MRVEAARSARAAEYLEAAAMCRGLYVASVTDKFPTIPKNVAETYCVKNTGQIEPSSGERSFSLDRRVSVAPMMDWTD